MDLIIIKLGIKIKKIYFKSFGRYKKISIRNKEFKIINGTEYCLNFCLEYFTKEMVYDFFKIIFIDYHYLI